MSKRESPLINPSEVTTLLGKDNVVIIDARGGGDARQRYESLHLRGAKFSDLETDLADVGPDAARGGRHPLPTVQRFAELLGKLNITPDTRVLVYDDKAGANAAARFWWMMKAAGHQEIKVIDGGLAALERSGLPMESGVSRFEKSAGPYPVNRWMLPTANIDQIESMRNNPECVVVDVRETYRYRGESEPIDLIAGHIPGAINLPYTNNLEDTGKFRSAHELKSMYEPVYSGRTADHVAVHCGSGVTACHTLLAMEVAGLPTPRLYVGSWSEWSRNEKPIATSESNDLPV